MNLIYFLVFLTALLLTILFTPLCKKIAIAVDMVDKPRSQVHKNHGRVVPLLGGVGMCTAWVLTIFIGIITPLLINILSVSPQVVNAATGIITVRNKLMIIVAGAILMAGLGLLDDKHALSAKIKFTAQFIIVAAVVTLGDIRVYLFISNPVITWIITVLWICTILNAINFFDNMDGLAAGISAIAFFFFSVIAIIFNQYFIACLSIAGLGTAIGFWIFNHSPASIFMGDAGSHFLGYILGLTASMTTYYQEGITISYLAVLLPLFILAIPLFDLLSVIVIRVRAGKPVYIGDNNHISHRFMRMGMSRKTAVLCVHILSLIISLSVMPILWGGYFTSFICLIQGILILLLATILQYSSMKDNN